LSRERVGDIVAGCAALAALLEVSAYPKPGNVHRTRDLPGTSFEHFLAGGVAIEPAMRRLALKGHDVQTGILNWSDVGIGHHVLEAVRDMLSWQKGGNVNLGIILLLAPLAAAAGSAIRGDEHAEVGVLRKSLKKTIRSTTPDDAVEVYEAIRLAVPGRVLGKVDELDVLDDSAIHRIKTEELSLLDVFRRSAQRDSVCREWVTGFETTFNVGYPYLKAAVASREDVNSAVVDTFLLLLSKQPDSLIIRKSGVERAQEVSEKSGAVLSEGGATTERGRMLLQDLDDELSSAGGGLNPGTTADLTAASIFVLLLEGWRP